MLELIVLGQIPGTSTQLNVSTVLYIMSGIALAAALTMYISVYSRELLGLRQQIQAIELISL